MNNKEFLKLANLTDAELEAARISVEDLRAIYDHYQSDLEALRSVGESIQRILGRIPGVHSTRVRVKDPISLVRKVVRKRRDAPNRNITLETYQDEIRDLIGLRALHLFKDDWLPVHQEILTTWNLHPQETALAYVRAGDAPDLIERFKKAGCEVKEKDAGYRSLHYVVQAGLTKKARNAEIQVRTLFEEAWSEIEHEVLYPDNQKDELLRDYLLILNRLAGGADEMASLLLRVRAERIFLRNIADEAELQSQILAKELKESREAIAEHVSKLKISEREKADLQTLLDSASNARKEIGLLPMEAQLALANLGGLALHGRYLAPTQELFRSLADNGNIETTGLLAAAKAEARRAFEESQRAQQELEHIPKKKG